MKLLVLVGAFLSLISCSQSDTFNRGYVISQSEMEAEQEVSSAEDPDSLH